MTREQIVARNDAIREAFDDPLVRALLRVLFSKPGSKRSSTAAYNAYCRAYRRKRHGQAT